VLAAGVPGVGQADELVVRMPELRAPAGAAVEVVLARPVGDRHAETRARQLAEPVGVEGAVDDHRPQAELEAQLADRLQRHLVDLRVDGDRVLVAEQPAQVLEVGLEVGLLALTVLVGFPRFVVGAGALES
jgi:hypothetical protein